MSQNQISLQVLLLKYVGTPPASQTRTTLYKKMLFGHKKNEALELERWLSREPAFGSRTHMTTNNHPQLQFWGSSAFLFWEHKTYTWCANKTIIQIQWINMFFKEVLIHTTIYMRLGNKLLSQKEKRKKARHQSHDVWSRLINGCQSLEMGVTPIVHSSVFCSNKNYIKMVRYDISE